MDLILVRHAIAEERDPSRWVDDSVRPLTAAGRKRFRQAASGLTRIVPTPGMVLTSRYERAQATATILEEVAGWPTGTPCAALEPAGGVEATLEALQSGGEHAVVALVGHEPDMSELLAALLAGSEGAFASEFRKGGVALVHFEGLPGRGNGWLSLFLAPRVLRRLRG